MEMEYRLLESGIALLLSRTPKLISDALQICFLGSASADTVIVEASGKMPVYHKLCGGRCSIPAHELHGEVKITAAVMGEHRALKKWVCEDLVCEAQAQDGVLVYPADMDSSKQIVSLRLEVDDLRGRLERLMNVPEEMEKLFSRLRDLERKTKVIM